MLLLEKVFDCINKSGLNYCVQNKYEMMPEETPSDIDMMYKDADEKFLDKIINDIAENTNLIITQKIVQDFGEFTYILSYPAPKRRFQLQLDFYRVISKGKIHNVLLADDLLSNKREYKNFFIPGRYEEIRYIIARRTLKKDLTDEHIRKIKSLYEDDTEKLKLDFGIDAANLIAKMLEKNDKSVFYDNYDRFLESVKRMSKKNYGLKAKTDYCLFKLFNYPTKRIFRKCGMSVAFLAPDGTGKSTVIDAISETVSGSFYGVKRLYFRPRLFNNLGSYNKLNPTAEAKVNNDPHSVKPHGKIKSLVRFLFYNIDFLLGTLLVVDRLKMKKQIVIFDRYYYDYYADMKRYQYSISKKWVSAFRFMIPNPDLLIILDAPSDVIYNRKKELSIPEIDAQREAFGTVNKIIKNSVIVDTNKDIEEVVENITEIILKAQAQKTKRIMKK